MKMGKRGLVSFALVFATFVGCGLAQDDTIKGADRSDVEAVIEDQKRCVSTPKEFVAAFEAREPRCVSDNLIGRVFSGTNASTVYLQVNSKPATFYSGRDALEMYLRNGYPESFGYFAPSRTVSISEPNFPGFQSTSSGFSMLQTIGYTPEYIDINSVYVLSVFDTRAIDTLVRSQNQSAYPFNADIGPISPTWDALKEYYEWVYDELDLVIPDAAIQILKNTSFMNLTGCPTTCGYVNLDFPSEKATTAVFTQPRIDYETCPAAKENSVQIDPSAPNQNSLYCKGYMGREWRPKIEKMDSVFTSRYCDPEQSVTAAQVLVDALRNTTDSIEQALWFRAFLAQSCIGSFFSLFSGNGFTYTGDNGLLQPTATEYIVSPFNVSDLGSDDVVDIYFCINGLNGGKPNEDGECPIPTNGGIAGMSIGSSMEEAAANSLSSDATFGKKLTYALFLNIASFMYFFGRG